ncbi:hypothetical protein JTE90_026658, partial [Oedothorax gibbosus]
VQIQPYPEKDGGACESCSRPAAVALLRRSAPQVVELTCGHHMIV